MDEFSLDLQGALDWAGEKRQELASAFLSRLTSLPVLGEDYDRQIKGYLSAVGQAVAGNAHWSFESERYFGKAGAEIQKHRKFTLLPKKK